ncbi:MAG TPA: c-type cytochrome [Candidatus Binataceae bacterium]|nr:c-type cytochrome [Candidatus Binataceae bacterium]
MAGRPGLDPAEEGKSYSALFVLMVALLLVVAVWSIWDDNISRRPWKEYQVEFDRLAYDNYMNDAAGEQKTLDANPVYVKLIKDLAQAQAELNSGQTAAQLADLKARLVGLKVTSDEKGQAVAFTKSYLTESWYDYNHALQAKEDPTEYKNQIDELDRELGQENAVADAAKAALQKVKDQIDAINSRVDTITDKLKVLTKKRDDLTDKADGYMIPIKFAGRTLLRYPKIPKIQQTAIDDFDRNAFDEAIARVDRCQSCHMGIDKKGFESAPQPFRTHSNFDAIIGKHPPDKLGCTPCHEGQGPAVNSIAMAHGDVEHWEHPLLTGDEMQSRCIKCHLDVGSLRGQDDKQIALNWVRGERLFQQMGCTGCHLAAGYEDLPKIGPYLKLASAKLDPSWTVRWITNPHLIHPHTRMPNFMFSREQATEIASYILSSSAKNSAAWLTAHTEPPTLAADLANPAFVEEGKGLFESVGCKGCHSVEPDKIGTPVGSDAHFVPAATRTAKDFAPNLAAIAEKTSPQWVYAWLKNPRDFSPHTAMPSLRLSDHEAEALTAFLMTHGKKQEDAGVETALKDPANITAGEALVRKYGCFGCHDIEGMDKESRIGVELTTEGSKHLDELFFGDRTDVAPTWNAWMFKKLQHPRIYATKDVEQLMPDFEFQDTDIENLRVFLASLTEGKVPERYRAPGTNRQQDIVNGRQFVNYYNCVGCHIIENRGGYIRRFYSEDDINFAPPILNGEGLKVQPNWLFTFLQGPTPIRPWLKVRMPTFHLTSHEDDTVVNYFVSLSDVQVPYEFLNVNLIPDATLQAGLKLTTKDYFNCFSCHQQGDKKPEGPPSGWAPDLAMAHDRLNPAWILLWLKNPQAVQPGTKMPSFYPGGPDDILNGNEPEQIKAIRDYIFWFGTHPGQNLPAQVAQGALAKPVKVTRKRGS